MAEHQQKVFYVASTHWDREWYEPFQCFRYHLVELLDEVLDTLDRDEGFACFQTDGQTCLVKDYLEIRPEREPLVRRRVQDKRLRIGPWYTMPDEYLVAGESLIRNLEAGITIANQYGGVSRVGFVCDVFGHVSQLPQILQGFGIDNALVWRGAGEDLRGNTFRWRSPDGSEVLAYCFGPGHGYFDFAAQVRQAFEQNEPFQLDGAVERAVDFIRQHRERSGGGPILLFDGGDHMPIEPQTVELLERLRRACPDLDFFHTGLDEFMAEAIADVDKTTCVCQGELRELGRLDDPCCLIQGVLSSRIHLKQDNRARENELCLWVEPFSYQARVLAGRSYPHSFIRRSWQYLLENHAHDSICGCSPDRVHRDMEFRFAQSRLINGKLIEQSLAAIATRVDLPDLEDEDFGVVLFNPTQHPVDGPVDFELEFPAKTDNVYSEFFGYERKAAFRLYGPDGAEIPYDYLNHRPQRHRFIRRRGKASAGDACLVVEVCAPLRIPALGYASLVCKPVKAITRHPAGKRVTGDRSLENAYLAVEVTPSGTLRLCDKRSGQTYDRLLAFEERADIGDGWYHGIAVNDEVYTSVAAHADVALVEDGAYRATLRITTRMHVPEQFLFDKEMRRSDRKAELVIDSYVTLRAGSAQVDIRIAIDNKARDHRVCALFETGAKADVYYADSAFDVIERPIALPADNHTYRELAVETRPQATWTAVCDGARGLAVVAPDLPETAVRDVPRRTLALTLLRGFRRTVYTDGEDGGQVLGRHSFRCCLVPFSGTVPRSELARVAQRLAGGYRAIAVRPTSQAPKAERTLPVVHGMLTLDPGRVVITSLRRREPDDRFELRCFNPWEEPATEVLTFRRPCAWAKLVDFEGNELERLKTDEDNRITLTVRPKQIVTIAACADSDW